MSLLGTESLEAGPGSYLGLHLNWELSWDPSQYSLVAGAEASDVGGNSALDKSHGVRPHGVCSMSVPLAATLH